MSRTLAVINEMKEIFERKNADYAGNRSEFFNFEYAALVAGPFEDPVDRTFAVMIGVKLGRLIALQGREAQNEAVEDTYKDLATYAALWAGYRSNPESALLEDLERLDDDRVGCACQGCDQVLYGEGLLGLEKAFAEHDCPGHA